MSSLLTQCPSHCLPHSPASPDQHLSCRRHSHRRIPVQICRCSHRVVLFSTPPPVVTSSPVTTAVFRLSRFSPSVKIVASPFRSAVARCPNPLVKLTMANENRHAGNIFFKKEAGGHISLIPIDHGYCLPEKFEDCTFDWLYWPQARQPYSADTVDYIKSLDAETVDYMNLVECREKCFRNCSCMASLFKLRHQGIGGWLCYVVW
ncbi:hypothetical protein HN873_063580 [Arachis hypogaea]|nr:Phosphatidylinositol 4-kinase gamma [Arachis hypogaea]